MNAKGALVSAGRWTFWRDGEKRDEWQEAKMIVAVGVAAGTCSPKRSSRAKPGDFVSAVEGRQSRKRNCWAPKT